MALPRATIVDIGLSNTGSVRNALAYLGVDAEATRDPEVVDTAEFVILPGVGSFGAAMAALDASGLADAIRGRAVDRPVLGICLGMQLLAEGGTEDGVTPGLGLIPGTVLSLRDVVGPGVKVPHVGFNSVRPADGSRLLSGLGAAPDFYFVHSYYLPSGIGTGVTGTCDYGVEFAAVYEHGLVMATQFHPEKSQATGLRLLSNALTSSR